ncbi:MAG: sensor histidine kinase [Chloroflexota bacterium]
MNANNNRAWRELLIIGLIALIISLLELYIDTFERLVIWASQRESLLFTEFVTLAVVFAIGFGIYSWRRWRELVLLEEESARLQKTVSEEQHAKELSRSYADAVTRGQEAERRRLARELHDDTIHQLILLNQKVELSAFDHADSPASADLLEMQGLIDETISHLRGFIQELRPTYLDELGLVAALKALIRKMRDRTDLLIEFDLVGNPCRLDESVELALYRIVQSALSNVVLHAGASMASVMLKFEPDQINLTIEDDGCGFANQDESLWVSEGHFGLVGIHERAEMLGAKYDVQSTPNVGTKIMVSVPQLGQSAPS